jgi:proteasome lid subunit RPN8/RPN11
VALKTKRTLRPPYQASDIADAIEHASEEMRLHQFTDYPEECVGLVTVDGSTIRLVNETTGREFRVSSNRIMEAVDVAGKSPTEIVAIYHSHVGQVAVPSAVDEAFMEYLYSIWPQVFHVILDQTGHRIWVWMDEETVEICPD